MTDETKIEAMSDEELAEKLDVFLDGCYDFAHAPWEEKPPGSRHAAMRRLELVREMLGPPSKAEAHTVATLRAALRKSEAERLAALGQVEDLREKLAAPALADEEKYARIGRMVVQLVKDYDLNRLVVQLPHPSPMCPCAECQGRFDNLGKGKP